MMRNHRTEHREQAGTEHGFQHCDIALEARHHAANLCMIVEGEREPLEMRVHIGTQVIQYLLPHPRHCPDLPVLRLPERYVHRQQHNADYRQPA